MKTKETDNKNKKEKPFVNSTIHDEDFFKAFISIINKEIISPQESELAVNFLSRIDSLKFILENNNGNHEELLLNLITYMKIEAHPANELMIRLGDKANKFYIILRGKICCLVPKDLKIMMTEDDYNNYLKKLKQYGEDELIMKCELVNASIFQNKKVKRVLPFKVKQEPKRHHRNEIITVENYIEKLRPTITESWKEKIEFTIFEYLNVVTLNTGEKFGDLALETTLNKRTASIITIEPTYLGILDKKSYDKSIKEANEKVKRMYMSFLSNNKLFFECDKFTFSNRYFNFFVKLNVTKGEKLLTEDEPSDNIYFLRNGEFQVSLKKSMLDLIHIIYYLDGIEEFKDKDIEEMQFSYGYSKFMKEKKLIKLNIISSEDIFGLDDCFYKGRSIFDLECLTKGEVLKMSTKTFNEINLGDDNLNTNTLKYIKYKKDLLKDRLNSAKDSRIKYYRQNNEEVLSSSLQMFVKDILFERKALNIRKKLKNRIQSSNPISISKPCELKKTMMEETNTKFIESIPLYLPQKSESKNKSFNRNKPFDRYRYFNIKVKKIEKNNSLEKSLARLSPKDNIQTRKISQIKLTPSESMISSNLLETNKKNESPVKVLDFLAFDNYNKRKTRLEFFRGLNQEKYSMLSSSLHDNRSIIKSASSSDLMKKYLPNKKENNIKISNQSVFQKLLRSKSSYGTRSIPVKKNIEFFIGNSSIINYLK